MKSSHRSVRSYVGLLTALSIIAAGCGGSDESGEDTAPSADATTTTAAATATTTATDETVTDDTATEETAPATTATDSEPTSTEAPADTSPASTAPVELTASARGVTADTITVGYTYIDFDDLFERGLVAQGWGDQEAAVRTLVDDINANGGILGRSLEVIYRPYSVLGTESAESVCLEMTADNEVFAVLGGFVGPAEPANTCIVGRGSTMLVGGVQSEERLAEATAPWVTNTTLRTRQAEVLITLLKGEGELEGRKIAVVASIDSEDVRDDVAALLSAAGSEPVEVLQSDAPIGDLVTEDANWATLAERIRGSGADTLLVVGQPSAAIRNVALQGLDVDIWATDSGSLVGGLGTSVDLETARGVMAAAPVTGQALFEEPGMASCLDAYAAGQPDVPITPPDVLQEGEEDIFAAVSAGCATLYLFTTIATAAGADLTYDSVAEAIKGLTQFATPGLPFASFGDKFDANDSFRLGSFNPDIGAEGGLDPITEIQDVTP